ncbi:sugar ABC transporter permease [Paenibacillus sp. MWE-103]|uniref:Sugar ABC transporter permease n=1 Tax=Paenibacillus artemisiicola TaxID=1172618 RepID=A0ABS3WJ69_9BACL|nr:MULTISPECIES: sugar ABC transporter permease [Paenibacillus]MBO7748350.1 sugar ABC transporter permease [Paenibacillus artemisiicola]SFI79756.1 raffinose/stachyose/melibiose transport system permease protein [Paenibacillus sp. UNC496MF]
MNIKSNRKSAERRFIAFSLTPILIIFAVFSVVPIVWGILLMFYNYSPLNANSPFVGFANFKQMLHNEIFLISFKNTFKFVLIAIPVNLVLTLAVALGIKGIRSRLWRNVFRTFFFLPCIAPLSGSALIWTAMLKQNEGLFNIVLERIGLDAVNWLNDPSMAMISIIMMTLWADIGYNIILFGAGLDSIPDMFYEAAKLDGAGPWRSFASVTLPLLSRTSVFVVIMTSISYFQMFPQFQIMTNGGPMNQTSVLALDIFNNAFSYMNMGYASAIAFVLLVMILIVTLIQLRLGRVQWEY